MFGFSLQVGVKTEGFEFFTINSHPTETRLSDAGESVNYRDERCVCDPPVSLSLSENM